MLIEEFQGAKVLRGRTWLSWLLYGTFLEANVMAISADSFPYLSSIPLHTLLSLLTKLTSSYFPVSCPHPLTYNAPTDILINPEGGFPHRL